MSRNALRLVRVGGSVVYSTCSLSPAQNDGVVRAALQRAFTEHSLVASIRLLYHTHIHAQTLLIFIYNYLTKPNGVLYNCLLRLNVTTI